MLPDFYAWPALSSRLFGGDYEFIHSIMQQKCGANWSEVKLCSSVQGRYESVDNSHSSNFRFPICGSPNGMQRLFVLTFDCTLMYHREVRFFPQENYGRLLKLVDRTDLGSVGASHESSSLSPPTRIKLTGNASFVW